MSDQGQIEIQLSHICNNRCVFCESGRLTELRMAKPVPLDGVVAALEDAAARGVKKVTFLGGEPTIQAIFFPALRRAADLGFQEIVVFTNGVRTPSAAFVDEVIAIAGRRVTWRISIQGGDEAAHDRSTEKPGSFAKIIAGLKNLRERDQTITANACLNEHNYRSVSGYVDLVKQYGLRQIHLDMFRPDDGGALRTEEYLQSILPRYSDMAAPLREMLKRFDEVAPDFDVNVGNYPYCQLPEWAHRIHHGGELTFTISSEGLGELSEFRNKYEQQRHDMVHPPQCEECVFRPACRGVSERYLKYYGDAELEPVRLPELRQIDREQRHFVLLAAPYVRALVGATPPVGWTLGRVVYSGRDRRIEASYRSTSGSTVALVFTPPPGAGAVTDPPAVFVTDRYTLGLRAEGATDAGPALSLFTWVTETLRAAPDVTVAVCATRDEVSAALLTPDRMSRALALLTAYVRKIETRQHFGDWSHRATRPAIDRLGAVATIDGPAGRGLEIAFEVQTEAQRPLVGATFHLADGTSPADVEAVVDEIRAALAR